MAPAMPNGAACTADQALTRLYHEHYRSLVRLAALLAPDADTAEAITQAAFAAMHEAWHRLGDTPTAAAYLRRAVVSRARTARQHHRRAGRQARGPRGERDAPAVLAMLYSLPGHQREALVLRYYGALTEAQAAAMGVSLAALRRHDAQGMAALRMALDHQS
jgi:DNA-directed RNA polymerase specialized sigma24 family protein